MSKPKTNNQNPADPLSPLKSDFRNLLYLVWHSLNLPEPTPLQYDLAYYLQHSDRRICIQAFRGVGKSWITAAYVVWVLLNDPQRKIMVVSASADRADQFSTFCKRIIQDIPALQHLQAKPYQRTSNKAFDVGPAQADHSPSVKSVGITGQLTGSRADVIVADDVEVPNNSATQALRDQLSEQIKEFDSVLKPKGRIVYLGTPQTEMSIYNVLPDRGYSTRIWPARYPKMEQVERYKGALAPWILEQIERYPSLIEGSQGAPTDPQRFSDADLEERANSYGKAGFALQFQLDTSLSDVDKFPLKLKDLVVMSTDPKKAPASLAWSAAPHLTVEEVPCVGLQGDRYYRPSFVSDDYLEYSGTVMTIDPSGRGEDETAYAVTRMLHGNIFLVAIGGYKDGYSTETLEALADIARRYQVDHIQPEANYGDGMFTQMFKPVLHRKYDQAPVEEKRVHGQKELRIIDTLEPVISSHRLVVDPDVIQADYEGTQYDPGYSLFYQLSRINRSKGALRHDDRLDALAQAVGYWVEVMAQDDFLETQKHREEMLDRELEDFMENAVGDGFQRSPGPTWDTIR